VANQWIHSFKDDTIFKSEIQWGFYQKLRANYGFTTSAMVQVAGPDIERHIFDARKTVLCEPNSVLKIVDIDNSVINGQVAELNRLSKLKRPPVWQSFKRLAPEEFLFTENELFPINHNVEFYRGDVAGMEAERFIDADLMTSVKTAGDSLEISLTKQREKYPFKKGSSEIKAFIFTISVRKGGGLKKNIEWVEEGLVPIIGSNVKYDTREKQTVGQHTTGTNNGRYGTYSYIYKYAFSSVPEVLLDSVLHFYDDDGGPMLTGIIVYY
jgi:hypothetical protein